MSSRNLGAPPSGIICHSGWITKRGANYHTWKKRWFVLFYDGFLLYFPSAEDQHHPLGIIYLQNAFLDRLSAEQCEKNRPHSFVVRSTTRRFILCSDTNTEKELWIKYIERIISQVTLKMRMIDSRRVSISPQHPQQSQQQQQLSSSPPQSHLREKKNSMESQEGMLVDKEIASLEKKISDCILHANAFESRISSNNNNNGETTEEEQESKKAKQKKTKKKKKKDNTDNNEEEESGEENDESEQSSSSSSTTRTDSADSDNDSGNDSDNEEEGKQSGSGRRRQNTLTSKSRRVANMEKMGAEMDKLLQIFTKMNGYLLTLEQQKQAAETEIQELKNHKRLLVKEVKNLRQLTAAKK